jgi:hypothetical protein
MKQKEHKGPLSNETERTDDQRKIRQKEQGKIAKSTERSEDVCAGSASLQVSREMESMRQQNEDDTAPISETSIGNLKSTISGETQEF